MGGGNCSCVHLKSRATTRCTGLEVSLPGHLNTPNKTSTPYNMTVKSQALFFLLLLTCMYLSLAQGSFGDCCLGYVSGMKSNAKKRIESYTMQETDGNCNIRAVVFLMKRRHSAASLRTICANPQHEWVQQVIKTVDLRNGIQN